MPMRNLSAILKRCPDTGLFVGRIPELPGAHSQGETLEELNDNLSEAIALILDDGIPAEAGESIV